MKKPVRILKLAFRVFLALSILASSTVGSAESSSTTSPLEPAAESSDTHFQSLIERTAQRAFLLDVRDRIHVTMQLNLDKLERLETCFSIVTTDPRFELLQCEKEKKIVRGNIDLIHPKLGRALAMLSLLDPYTHRRLNEIFNRSFVAAQEKSSALDDWQKLSMTVVENKNFSAAQSFFSTVIKKNADGETVRLYGLNDLMGGVWEEEEFPEIPVTNEDIISALSGGTQFIPGTTLFENFQNFSKVYCRYTNGEDAKFCDARQLRFDPGSSRIYWDHETIRQFAKEHPEEYAKILARIQGRSKAKPNRGQLRKNSVMEQRLKPYYAVTRTAFYQMVQEAPYVALVGERDSQEDESAYEKKIAHALKIMRIQATEVLKKYEQRLKNELTKPDVSNQVLTELMHYEPVATWVTEHPGKNMKLVSFDYNQVFERVHGQHIRDELKGAAILMGEMIAVNGLCFVPIGRMAGALWKGAQFLVRSTKGVLKVQKWSSIFKPLCMSAIQIPMNGWFLYESIEDYKTTYAEVFSSPELSKHLADVESLSSADQAVVFSILFAPLGVVSLKQIATLQGKVSKPLFEILKKRAASPYKVGVEHAF